MSDVIEVGQWVVVRGTYSWEVGKVTRVTGKLLWRTDDFFKGRHHRADKERVAFAGAEATARRLAQQFESSRAQANAEKIIAEKRHEKRIDGFIAEARTKVSP